jgi:hypothetical protein
MSEKSSFIGRQLKAGAMNFIVETEGWVKNVFFIERA